MDRRHWIIKFASLRFFLSGCETYLIAPTAWNYIKSLDQTTFFLALVLSAYNFGCIIAGPVGGFLTDRLGNPRFIFLCSCATKIFSYILYSINLSAYFPLFGRLISGLGGEMGVTVLLGQIALQPEKESRGGNFVLLDSAYCLGTVFGPGIGSFITFRTNILGWEIDEGNSPGMILTIIWLLFFIFAMLMPNDIWIATGAHNFKNNLTVSDDEAQKSSNDSHLKRRQPENSPKKPLIYAVWNSRLFCLLFLIFSSEVFSSTSTFYVPLLALDHFHLQLIHTKLLFLNCTLFTLVLFICIYLASQHVKERKLLVAALLMQIIAISFLTYLAFSWDQANDVQWYLLLLYICFGMPYFAYPLGNSILSKITNPQNATFIQGLSYGGLHVAIVVSRVVVSFVFTKANLLWYSFALFTLWLAGIIWYGTQYKRMVPDA